MTPNPFALRIAPGVYVDQDGSILHTPPPAVPAFEAPFQLPIERATVRDVAKQVSEGLKGATTNQSFLLDLRVWGNIKDPERSNVVKLLGTLADVATA